MNILGISAGHDAAVSVINRQGDILFAGHSERYSKIKNDADINIGLIDDLAEFDINQIAYYERPWAKQLRRLYSGEGLQWTALTAEQCIHNQLGSFYNTIKKKNVIDPLHPDYSVQINAFNHHLSHAAAGFQTSPFDRATVVVIDAIGEWDTISIFGAEYDGRGRAKYKKLWGQRYPHSIGLFYSAVTEHVGLTPMEEEYILMGMAAYGKSDYLNIFKMKYIQDEYDMVFKENHHVGLDATNLDHLSKEDFAATTQTLTENLIYNVMCRARDFEWSKNLVYMGGVALNCSANKKLGSFFDRLWIMPNPGDAGSSLGAAALAYGKRVNFNHAFLGHNIAGAYPVDQLHDRLLSHRIVGVASGRAEFGPRALGNRSLLADPRGPDIKEKVNEIKRRQQFRPFAPVILEEMANKYFNMPCGWRTSPYMQSVAQCRTPDDFPAIVHVDGSSRVQTVGAAAGSGLRQLLEKWYATTGCPMLLNTSLNIRGEPMVNDRADADRFEMLYNVKVMS